MVGTLLPCLLILIYFILTWKWRSDFEDQLRELKEDGRPHSIQSLKNIYKKRFPVRKDYYDWKLPNQLQKLNNKIIQSNIPDDWMYKSKKKRIRHAKTILELVNNFKNPLFSQLKKSIYPSRHKLSLGLDAPVSHIVNRQTESKIFLYYALSLIVTGKLRKAIPIVRNIYNRGRILRKNPYIISFLVSNIFTSRANEAVKYILQRPELPDETISIFEHGSPQTIKKDLLFAFESDLVIKAYEIRRTIKANYSHLSSKPNIEMPKYFPHELLWLSASNFVQRYRKCLKLFGEPYYITKNKLEGCSSVQSNLYNKYFRFFSSEFLPSFVSLYEIANDSKAKMDLNLLAVKAKLRSQGEQNRLIPIPDLDESTDPYSGKPYKVKEVKSHIILYSVGENLKDDGGSIKGKKGEEPKDVGVKIRK